MPEWLETPSGAHVLAWEQRHLDAAVADLFGFHALQLGLLEGLVISTGVAALMILRPRNGDRRSEGLHS